MADSFIKMFNTTIFNATVFDSLTTHLSGWNMLLAGLLANMTGYTYLEPEPLPPPPPPHLLTLDNFFPIDRPAMIDAISQYLALGIVIGLLLRHLIALNLIPDPRTLAERCTFLYHQYALRYGSRRQQMRSVCARHEQALRRGVLPDTLLLALLEGEDEDEALVYPPRVRARLLRMAKELICEDVLDQWEAEVQALGREREFWVEDSDGHDEIYDLVEEEKHRGVGHQDDHDDEGGTGRRGSFAGANDAAKSKAGVDVDSELEGWEALDDEMERRFTF